MIEATFGCFSGIYAQRLEKRRYQWTETAQDSKPFLGEPLAGLCTLAVIAFHQLSSSRRFFFLL